jgi:ABC-2 type transport system ATP-binding protein
LIQVRDLRFDYPGTRALDGVSFRLAAGSVTALVGPNGAGKTTLLRCLAGLDAPHGGSVMLDGIDVGSDPRAAHERLGFLPDHFGLYAELSARRCLQHAGASRGLNGADLDRRIDDTARSVGLQAKLDHKAGSLSRGQRQRLALAQAILHRPNVLLLDEPASGLDPEARAALSELMRSLATGGMTLLVSSHILAELETYCSAMLVLSGGRVLEHRPSLAGVSAGGGHPPTARRLRIRLAQPVEDPERLRARLPAALSDIRIDRDRIEASSTVDDAALPALLRELLALDLPVCEFTRIDTSLQQQYLVAVREARP